MKASIIIPSYNASERLYLNLISLKYQDCSKDAFEVIVIDNGSLDDTQEMLSNFKADFPLKIVRVTENKGIARGRNRGILEASGDILIFHDSDMLAAKNFVRRHLEAHDKENITVCGLPWLRIYSHFYKDFASYQITEFNSLKDKYNLETDFSQSVNSRIITEDQIEDGSFLSLSFDLNTDFIASLKEIVTNYGQDLTGYNLPWKFFITNNASVDRKLVINLGLFDENIIKYGFEDYDLGIRLYKVGSQFKLLYDIVSVHQEHPRNVTTDDVKENINYMCKKYNNIYFIDMILQCLSYAVPIDYKIMNSIMSDIHAMKTMGRYDELLNFFLKILQTAINISLGQNQGDKLTLLPEIYSKLGKISWELNELRNKYELIHFPAIFSGLAKSIFSIYL